MKIIFLENRGENLDVRLGVIDVSYLDEIDAELRAEEIQVRVKQELNRDIFFRVEEDGKVLVEPVA